MNTVHMVSFTHKNVHPIQRHIKSEKKVKHSYDFFYLYIIKISLLKVFTGMAAQHETQHHRYVSENKNLSE